MNEICDDNGILLYLIHCSLKTRLLFALALRQKKKKNPIKAVVNLLSCAKKRILFLHENTHHNVPYQKNYFF